MPHAITQDTRMHVLGDLHLVTGTFTDGGTEIDLTNQLSNVFACGAHGTSIQATGVTINDGDLSGPAFTVDAAAAGINDCRFALQIGQTIYNAGGARLGIVSALAATTVTIEVVSTNAVVDGAELYVMGAHVMDLGILIEAAPNTHRHITSIATASYDATNNLLIVTAGSKKTGGTNNAASVPTLDGSWWALGQR